MPRSIPSADDFRVDVPGAAEGEPRNAHARSRRARWSACRSCMPLRSLRAVPRAQVPRGCRRQNACRSGMGRTARAGNLLIVSTGIGHSRSSSLPAAWRANTKIARLQPNSAQTGKYPFFYAAAGVQDQRSLTMTVTIECKTGARLHPAPVYTDLLLLCCCRTPALTISA